MALKVGSMLDLDIPCSLDIYGIPEWLNIEPFYRVLYESSGRRIPPVI